MQEEFECRDHDADVVELAEDREEVGKEIDRPDQVERRSGEDQLRRRRHRRLLDEAERQPGLRQQRLEQTRFLE